MAKSIWIFGRNLINKFWSRHFVMVLSLALISSNAAWAEPLSPVTWDCLERTASEFNVPLAVLVGIMDQESGQVGKVSKNKNGTYDVGPMQINSEWLPKLKAAGVSEEDLCNNGCVNVAAAGWLLRALISSSPSIQDAIAKYHSPKKDRGEWYLRKVIQRMYTLDADATLTHANQAVFK